MIQATRRTAQSEHEQVVRNVLASMTDQCGRVYPLHVLAWERRAITLALLRSYDRSDISCRGTSENGDTLYAVTADSHSGARYHVTVHPIAHPECSCMAGQNNQPCKHAGLALGVWAEEREMARQAQWMQEWAHLNRQEHRDYCELMAAHFDGMEG